VTNLVALRPRAFAKAELDFRLLLLKSSAVLLVMQRAMAVAQLDPFAAASLK
jgi:hypothetical protein